ncbi:MAG: SdrD B-like domain-containing protein, partial [Sediminibacterium sp.]|nr:SdrD B-like domain-containing protein [Sediminibacterium sp.]
NAAGDILKASNNGTYTSFTLESNGSDGTNTSAGAGNGEGPGGGEFYFTDRFSENLGGVLGIGNTSTGKLYIDHEETSTGSILNFPGKELISTAFDPITTWYTGGVRYYNNNNGVAVNGKVLYTGNDVSVFGKANGLGDLEIITAPAPIEIGNRVWFDVDGDGIQDAEEIGIAGVTVSLVQGTTVIATATTDADGNYIFSSDPNGVNTASAIYNISQIQPGAALIIRIANATGTSVQTPLSTYELTVINNGGLDVDADLRDSDAALTGNDAEISITAGIAGENNHTYDFGFVTIGGVGGGGGGGVESKSLGDAIAYRVFNRAVKSEQGPVDYTKLPTPDQYNRYAGTSVGTALKLQDILPTKLSNGYKSFVSTPNDIISITNAKEILSIDFVSNNVSKAVAFGTRTVGQVYDHTKAICDRLKGFELISLKKINVKGYELVQYNLKNNNGEIEYATSFIIGAESGRNNYTIQSNWLNKDYTLEEMMYNIQLWGGSPSLVIEMATDIITRLNSGLPVVA